MSTATAVNYGSLSRAQLATEYRTRQDAVKALETKGGPALDDLTPDEETQLGSLLDERDAIKAELDRRPAPEAVKARIGAGNGALYPERRVPHPTPAPAGGGGQGTARNDGTIELIESEDDKYVRRGPWKGLGHFAQEVKRGGVTPGHIRDGLLGQWNGRIGQIQDAVKAMDDATKAVSGMSELVDTDGAAFVPLEISSRVWDRAIDDQQSLLGLVDVTPVAGSMLKMTAYNDKSRATGLYGARAYWGPEGGQSTGTTTQTRDITWQLKKCTVLMYVTEELYQDAPALDSRLNRVAAANFAYEMNRTIVRGNGTGEPLGILSAGVTGTTPRITVSAVSGQGANTIIGSNVTTMFSRRNPGADQRLVWLYNVSIEPQLDQLNFATTAGGTNTTAMTFMYLQSGGLRGRERPELKGRPMYEIEHCSLLGTEGDLILWDPQSYGVIVKTTGVQQAVSMHLRFDYGELAYRWVLRMDGRPFWDDVLTPPQSGATRAPIVTLNSSRT